MNKAKSRDIEKVYPRQQFILKLRRLADALEANKPFTIQVESERLTVPKDAIANIEHERVDSFEELEFQVKWKKK